MIKYHGTPIGGTKFDAIKFLKGRHALISMEYQNQVAEVLECSESFCLDNGAFTKWKKDGDDISLPDFLGFVVSLEKHPRMDFYIAPDKIMGTEADNNDLLESWLDMKGDIRNCAPVFHLGEHPDRFLKLAEEYPLVCFGSTEKWARNGSRLWWKQMIPFMDYVTDEYGNLPCKVHGLRMLDINIFKHLPLHSGDSTNAAVNGHISMKKGPYPCVERWQGSERIAQRVESYQSPAFWDSSHVIKELRLNDET